jgi:hypothetical protein
MVPAGEAVWRGKGDAPGHEMSSECQAGGTIERPEDLTPQPNPPAALELYHRLPSRLWPPRPAGGWCNIDGPNSGKELELVKNLTTLGKPGVQVAVLARRPHGYFITHVEGGSFPTVNGSSIGEQPHQLRDHDLIELAGMKMEFYFKT